MSNTSQKKVDEKTLKDVQAKLIEKGKAAGGSLTTEEFAAAMAPLGADMDQIEETYHVLSEAGVEVLPPADEPLWPWPLRSAAMCARQSCLPPPGCRGCPAS